MEISKKIHAEVHCILTHPGRVCFHSDDTCCRLRWRAVIWAFCRDRSEGRRRDHPLQTFAGRLRRVASHDPREGSVCVSGLCLDCGLLPRGRGLWCPRRPVGWCGIAGSRGLHRPLLLCVWQHRKRMPERPMWPQRKLEERGVTISLGRWSGCRGWLWVKSEGVWDDTLSDAISYVGASLNLN